MNSQLVINTAVQNNGFKSWYLRHSIIGKKILTKALESKYGKQERILSNGVRKFTSENTERGKKSTKTIYLEPEKFKIIRTTIRKYNEGGKRISLYSASIDVNDKHKRTTTHISDSEKLGRRDYTQQVLKYDLNTLSWVVESVNSARYTKLPNGEYDIKR